MPQAITSLPPVAQYVDYSAEIPGIEAQTIKSVNFWSGDEGLTFAEFLDVINPLQHLPVISSIYRAVTGDEIGLGARLLGGALFGGPLGILAAGVNAAFEEMSGGNIAAHAVALFEEITGSGDEKPQLALEPRTAKPGEIVAATPVGPAAADQSGPAPIRPLNSPDGVPAPGAILPPIRPPSVARAVPATAPPPTEPTPTAGNPPEPVSAMDAERLRLGAMQLPAALNAPSRNSIARFNGQSGDAISRRISQTILDGQRAQAQLLLASLRGGNGKAGQTGKADQNKDQSIARQAVQATAWARAQIPARQAAHPNLPPTGASTAWFQQAMDRALDRYKTNQGPTSGNGDRPSFSR